MNPSNALIQLCDQILLQNLGMEIEDKSSEQLKDFKGNAMDKQNFCEL